jgi:[ribosomal protein S5]-alanine N-acetyltransferase
MTSATPRRATRLLTKNLELVPLTREQVRAIIETMDASAQTQLSADWLALFHASTESDPWVHGFSALDRGSGLAVGSGSFKGPPTGDGVVEIAYAIASEHQGKGDATEVAQALVAFAFDSAEVRAVRAHTLPASHASKRVLAKCGFDQIAEVIDPEDGWVCRFEKPRAPHP